MSYNSIRFITGNPNKFSEAQAIFGNLEQLDLDLPEIQEIDAKEIIKAKLIEALKHQEGELIVEDTSLYLDALNGLPGPFIKWFLKTIGNEGIYNLAAKLGNVKAEARTIIGYAKNKDEIYFFEGSVSGEIIAPVGETTFGWDPIFKPDGFEKNFAQMSRKEKNKISMRKIAFTKLKEFLINQKSNH